MNNIYLAVGFAVPTVVVVTCLLLALLIIVALAVPWGKVRRRRLVRLVQRSRPLVTAIEHFETKYGKPPDALERLVPEFLSAVPASGFGSDWTYEYFVTEDQAAYKGNAWILKVDVTEYLMGPPYMYEPEWMIYFPRQNYSDIGTLEIIDWAHVVEIMEDWARVEGT